MPAHEGGGAWKKKKRTQAFSSISAMYRMLLSHYRCAQKKKRREGRGTYFKEERRKEGVDATADMNRALRQGFPPRL